MSAVRDIALQFFLGLAPMSRRILSIFISILLAIIGVFESLGYKDWGILERFGALITIVGFVSFAFVNEGEVASLHEAFKTDRIREIISQPVVDDAANMERWILVEEAVRENNLDAVRAFVQLRNKRTEILIFCLGTLLWAWGSYIPKLLNHLSDCM